MGMGIDRKKKGKGVQLQPTQQGEGEGGKQDAKYVAKVGEILPVDGGAMYSPTLKKTSPKCPTEGGKTRREVQTNQGETNRPYTPLRPALDSQTQGGGG